MIVNFSLENQQNNFPYIPQDESYISLEIQRLEREEQRYAAIHKSKLLSANNTDTASK